MQKAFSKNGGNARIAISPARGFPEAYPRSAPMSWISDGEAAPFIWSFLEMAILAPGLAYSIIILPRSLKKSANVACIAIWNNDV